MLNLNARSGIIRKQKNYILIDPRNNKKINKNEKGYLKRKEKEKKRNTGKTK